MQEIPIEDYISRALTTSQTIKTQLGIITEQGPQQVTETVAESLQDQYNTFVRQIRELQALAPSAPNHQNALHRLEQERETLQTEIRVVSIAAKQAAERERQQKLFGELTKGDPLESGNDVVYARMSQYSKMLDTSVNMAHAGTRELDDQTSLINRISSKATSINAKIGVGVGIMKDIFKVNAGNKGIWIGGTALVTVIIVVLMIFNK